MSGKNATIHTFTIIRTAPTGFEDLVPYCVAVVDTGTEKVCSRIAGYTADVNVTVGQQVRTIADPQGSELFELVLD